MSVSSEVQRTLVKSPPELWAELSDPAALARHLGELGEIRITRVEPEKTVEWESAGATGAVRLKPSGWGTKVTLTVTRDVPAPEPTVASEPTTAEPVVIEPMATEPVATEPIVTEPIAMEPVAAEPTSEPEPDVELPVEPASRRGFFARLFGRRPKATPVVESQLESEPEPEPQLQREPEPQLQREPEPQLQPEPEPEVQDEPQPDLAAELAALEEALVAETQAVLTTVLDRLGAAHHRPFSRS
jgi:hypothetical protein